MDVPITMHMLPVYLEVACSSSALVFRNYLTVSEQHLHEPVAPRNPLMSQRLGPVFAVPPK